MKLKGIARCSALIVLLAGAVMLGGCDDKDKAAADQFIQSIKQQIKAEKDKGTAGDQKLVAKLEDVLAKAEAAKAAFDGASSGGSDIIGGAVAAARPLVPFPWNLALEAVPFVIHLFTNKKSPAAAPAA